MTVRQHVPRFQWFAGAALALLLAETLVRGGRRVPRRGVQPSPGRAA